MLEAYGGLPGLKVLELELEGLDNELENALWIAGLGKLCPKVERFWGDYEVGISAVSHFVCFNISFPVTHASVTLSRSWTRIVLRPTPTSSCKCGQIPIPGTERRVTE